jgi:hypothetical protein
VLISRRSGWWDLHRSRLETVGCFRFVLKADQRLKNQACLNSATVREGGAEPERTVSWNIDRPLGFFYISHTGIFKISNVAAINKLRTVARWPREIGR